MKNTLHLYFLSRSSLFSEVVLYEDLCTGIFVVDPVLCDIPFPHPRGKGTRTAVAGCLPDNV